MVIRHIYSCIINLSYRQLIYYYYLFHNIKISMHANLQQMPFHFIPNAVGVKQYAVIQYANPTYRQAMEDTSFIIDSFIPNCPKSTLFGVFDGHGGSGVSKKLPTLMTNIIKVNLNNKTKPKQNGSNIKNMGNDFRAILQASFEQADQKLLQAYDGESGATGTVGLIRIEQSKRVLYLGYVGDSSAYLFSDHECQQLMRQHRANNPEQKKRVEANGGKIMQNRLCGVLAVTRAFGDFSLKKMGLTASPQVTKVQIRLPHKYLIVASDGLWDFIGADKIQKLVREENQADLFAKRLMKLAVENGSNDNITIEVFKLN